MPRLKTIAFDADDTLWHNERFFRDSEEQFRSLLGEFAEPEAVGEALLDAERRNIRLYGFGIKGFTLSMVETAATLAGERLPAPVIEQVLALGKAMLDHPVELFDGVEETLESLAREFSLMVITKGDLFDQERKLEASNLQDHFDHIEIVSDKTTETYRRIFDRHGQGTSRAMMIGNSLKSDVIPALEAGAWSVHVPHGLTWALEHADEPLNHPRYRKVSMIADVPDLIADLESNES